jgi:hypothetical protein
MSFHVKRGIVSLVLGLTTVMVIYWFGIGSYDSTVCSERYHYSVERLGYRCRLLGFPTAYVENDAWGHNAHVHPWAFLLNMLFWSAGCFAALGLPTIAVAGCLLGIAGVYRQLRTAPRDRPADNDFRGRGALTNLVLALPFFMAVWIFIAMIFVGWVPEVV